MANIALIPAAGTGSRFGAAIPKQYTPLLGTPVLQHTLNIFAANPRIARTVVITAPEDRWFARLIRQPENASVLPCGGESRAQSIANGLHRLLAQNLIHPNDTILVHDAARCCLPQSALNRLLDTLDGQPESTRCGALLAIPAADTLKRQAPHADPPRANATLPREHIWQAQTPQAFQAALLQRALAQADLSQTTDDASAVEQLGIQPLLVQGDSRNIKLTCPDDALLAECFLRFQAAP